ncbi:hypothetical protein LCGC14_1339050 [marine sediment metagenome]|uniref:Uncharacterized protein n=1 Tax=marine sediment metagenome TaxID=412755 RepID=A0A0F9KEY0_9ZZZZ
MSSASRTFTVSGENVTIAGGATLVFINPDTDVGIEVLRCWASQSGTDTSEQLRVGLHTQVSTFPTLTTKVPVPHLLGETSKIIGGTAGAAGTSGINASAEGGGAKIIILPDNMNNLNGFLYIPTPEERMIVRAAASSGFGMQMIDTPTVLTGWSFGITFREI